MIQVVSEDVRIIPKRFATTRILSKKRGPGRRHVTSGHILGDGPFLRGPDPSQATGNPFCSIGNVTSKLDSYSWNNISARDRVTIWVAQC